MIWVNADKEPRECELLVYGDPKNNSLQVGHYYKDTIGFCELSEKEVTGEIVQWAYVEPHMNETDVKITDNSYFYGDWILCESCDGEFMGIHNYCPHCGKRIMNISDYGENK